MLKNDSLRKDQGYRTRALRRLASLVLISALGALLLVLWTVQPRIWQTGAGAAMAATQGKPATGVFPDAAHHAIHFIIDGREVATLTPREFRSYVGSVENVPQQPPNR